MLNTFKK